MKTPRKISTALRKVSKANRRVYTGAASVGGTVLDVTWKPQATHVINYRHFQHELTPRILPGALPLFKYVAEAMEAGLTPRALEKLVKRGKTAPEIAKQYKLSNDSVRRVLRRWGLDAMLKPKLAEVDTKKK